MHVRILRESNVSGHAVWEGDRQLKPACRGELRVGPVGDGRDTWLLDTWGAVSEER
jgi:hypothetical protein